jgi:putative transposase
MALEVYKSNNNVVFSSKYPCVWTPQDRRSVLVGPIAKGCEPVMRQTAEKYRAEIIAWEIMPDHVHVLVAVDPQFGIHRWVKNLKGCFMAPIAARVSHMEITATRTLDESRFRIHGWRGTTGGHRAICGKS